jgi:hypothetical protein
MFKQPEFCRRTRRCNRLTPGLAAQDICQGCKSRPPCPLCQPVTRGAMLPVYWPSRL